MRRDMRLSVKFLAILFLACCLHASAARAQTKEVPEFSREPPGVELSEPDWSQFLPPSSEPEKPKASFYERCMLSPDPVLNGGEQRDMCACMAANDELSHKNKPNQYWVNTLTTRPVTPYETFATQILAPCIYIEARAMASDYCYQDRRASIQFASPQAFDAYCGCYADSVESYLKQYAQPLLAARLAAAGEQDRITTPDPLKMIWRDGDFNQYASTSRQQCLDQYKIKPAGVE